MEVSSFSRSGFVALIAFRAQGLAETPWGRGTPWRFRAVGGRLVKSHGLAWKMMVKRGLMMEHDWNMLFDYGK